MKLIFIDAENIGLKTLSEQDFSILDKVFVFSNDPEAKAICEQNLYLSLSGYPQKNNQADFCIVAYLSRALSNLTKQQRNKVTFVLYSKDSSLIEAFKFQCELVNALYAFPLIEENIVTLYDEQRLNGEKIFLDALSSPLSAREIMVKLNLTQSEFSKIIGSLIREGKIKRSSENTKKWVSV